GSNYFERVTYRLEPVPGGVNLIIRVVEKTTNFFKVGLNYNSEMNAALLLNATLRNVLIEGSRISLDLRLGNNLNTDLTWIIHTGLKPGFAIKDYHRFNRLDVYAYDYDGNKLAEFDFSQHVFGLEIMTTYANSFCLSTGMELELNTLKNTISPAIWNSPDEEHNNLLSYLIEFNLDMLDKSVYPLSGVKLHLLSRYITQEVVEQDGYSPFFRFFVEYHERLRLNPWWSTYFKFWGASVQTEKEITTDKIVYLGSQTVKGSENIPFLGLEFMELSARHGATALVGAQYEFFPNWFLLYEFNVGKVSNKLEYLFRDISYTNSKDVNDINNQQLLKERYVYGGGLTIGTESPIGPIEVTLTRNSRDSDLNFYFSVGYQF
ncbi:MAG: hypothetical protein K8S56_00145, partial [Candidatus Cloacimonetes bacterium]|nr:hypothetical protein [Candidatus Cloacimonadota bacterium]